MPETRERTTRSNSPHPMRHGAVICLIVLGLVLAIPGSAAARDTAARKFGRGAANMGLGVLAVPGQIVKTTQDNGPFIGATWGFLKGVGFMAASEVVGVYEFLTCPFEAPPDFKPIMKPEYPWQYFGESR